MCTTGKNMFFRPLPECKMPCPGRCVSVALLRGTRDRWIRIGCHAGPLARGRSYVTANSVVGPDSRRDEFEQMLIGVAEVKAPSAPLPFGFTFDFNPAVLQP